MNATSFVAGDVIVVSWNFTRTTVASTDLIQASGASVAPPCPCLTLSWRLLVAMRCAARLGSTLPSSCLHWLQLFIAPASSTLATVQATLNPIKFKLAGGNSQGSVR